MPSTTIRRRGTWVFGVTVDDNPNPVPPGYLISKNALEGPGRLPVSTLYTIINEPQVDNDMFNLRTAAESPSVPSRIALQGRY